MTPYASVSTDWTRKFGRFARPASGWSKLPTPTGGRSTRSLHDGVQQFLVALAIDLQRLSALLDGDRPGAKRLLDELSANAQQALDDTAKLAHTIYPPLLEARGLISALRSAADSAGVALVVDIPRGARYPPEITAALYWSCLEALSSAPTGSEAVVRILGDSGDVTFEIAIAGRVAQDRVDRLRDRLEALDGRVSVEHPTDGSARVHGWLPLPR